MAIAEVAARITADISQFQGKMGRVKQMMNGTAQDMTRTQKTFTGVGRAVGNVGRTMASTVTPTIGAVGVAAVMMGANFEESMSKVQAITGATGEDFTKLEDLAKQLGAETKYSASEAAEAMTYLGMAGFDTNQILSAMPSMLSLATAGNLDLASAADIASNILSGFGMDAGQAGHMADVLAYAASNSNTSVQQLGNAMSYAAPIAHSMGISLEEATAAVGMFSDAGIQGEKAGTSLRGVIASLSNPVGQTAKKLQELGLSADDVNPKTNSLADILKKLEAAGMDSSEAMELVGVEAGPALAYLLEEGSGALESFTGRIEEADGTADRMAKTMADNTKGGFKAFTSALESLGIAISDVLLPTITKLTDWITKVVRSMAGWSDATKTVTVVVGGLGFALGPILMLLGPLISLFGIFGVAALKVAGIVGGLVIAVTACVAIYNSFSQETRAVISTIFPLQGAFEMLVEGVKAVKGIFQEAIPEVDRFGNNVSKSTKQALGSYFKLEDEATASLKRLYWSGDVVTKDTADKITGNFDEMTDKVIDGIEKKRERAHDALSRWFDDGIITEKQFKKMSETTDKFHDKQAKIAKEGRERVNKIFAQAKKEKRSITEEEYAEIREIMRNQNSQAMDALTKSQMEQKVILERTANQSKEIKAREASDIIKESRKAADKTIKESEKATKKNIEDMMYRRDVIGDISAEEADKKIKEFEKGHEEVKKMAEEGHKKVVDEAIAQAGEHGKAVDKETGDILSKWDVFMNDMDEKWNAGEKWWDEFWPRLFGKLGEWWDDGVEGFFQFWDDLEAKWDAGKAWWDEFWNDVGETLMSKWEEFKLGLITKWEEINQAAIDKWEGIKNWIVTKVEQTKQRAVDKWEQTKQAIGNKWDQIKSWAIEKWEQIKSYVVDKVEGMKSSVTNKVENMKQSVIDKWEQIKQWTIDKVENMRSRVTNKYEELKRKIRDKVEEAKKAVSDKFTDMVSIGKKKAGEIVEKVIKGVSDLPGKMKKWGKNAVDMFGDGMMAKAEKVYKEAKKIAKKIESVLGFRSPTEEGPASDSDKWMPNMMDMFADGIKTNIPKISRMASMAAGELKDAMELDQPKLNVVGSYGAEGFGGTSNTYNYRDTYNPTIIVRNDNDLQELKKALYRDKRNYFRSKGRVR